MDGYSRIVAFLKVLLPLAALGLLSTLFLISRGSETETKIPFAKREIEERTRDQQVTAPFFSGTTAQGDEIMVTASLARPGGNDTPAVATDLNARIRMADGSEMTLQSDTGRVRLDKDKASFIGNVEIVSSTGIVINTDRLNTALSGVSGNSPGPITGAGPIGDFTAGTMHFSSKSEGGPVHMLFNEGVKLIYTPQKPER
ncbi:hypothetical protein QEZ52_01685 [Aliisedimentitalea scapharcae]|uniref:Lipopolysaccharide export system protein LptC n=1 Tax=Aliisedimentitalea scapharcae TaxID=1524259 RepID=A0ABZ2XVB7_9RHOB|nr:hypothetical protein K3727_01390 [Rhodobacteraceae bacterium M382]